MYLGQCLEKIRSRDEGVPRGSFQRGDCAVVRPLCTVVSGIDTLALTVPLALTVLLAGMMHEMVDLEIRVSPIFAKS